MYVPFSLLLQHFAAATFPPTGRCVTLVLDDDHSHACLLYHNRRPASHAIHCYRAYAGNRRAVRPTGCRHYIIHKSLAAGQHIFLRVY